MHSSSPGYLFRQALLKEKPLQIVGVVNAYCALMAQDVGFKALYLSGAGVANACFGLPDLGMTSLDNVLQEVQRITSVSALPLLVDVDTGWGSILNVARTTSLLARAGAAGLHLEDQILSKRCGHREGKKLIHVDTMSARIRAAVQAKPDPHFVVMARTDAYSVEGLEAAIARSRAYVAAGADMIFAEALEHIEDYKPFVEAVGVPVLANMTEFGKTPLYDREALKKVGVSMALYPLTAFRAMNQAALETYQVIRETGTQQSLLPRMQTREALYQFLDYVKYEHIIDEALKKDEEHEA
ncbi:MAG: methylisocitrate lyase [Gammaproteobacteria bacterium]|nr:methylisocitrate lyase [Gammaproteobacteria bacterium]